MAISEKLILELQEIIEKEYGIHLSLKEARKMGEDLVEFFEVLIEIDQREKDEK